MHVGQNSHEKLGRQHSDLFNWACNIQLIQDENGVVNFISYYNKFYLKRKKKTHPGITDQASYVHITMIRKA